MPAPSKIMAGAKTPQSDTASPSAPVTGNKLGGGELDAAGAGVAPPAAAWPPAGVAAPPVLLPAEACSPEVPEVIEATGVPLPALAVSPPVEEVCPPAATAVAVEASGAPPVSPPAGACPSPVAAAGVPPPVPAVSPPVGARPSAVVADAAGAAGVPPPATLAASPTAGACPSAVVADVAGATGVCPPVPAPPAAGASGVVGSAAVASPTAGCAVAVAGSAGSAVLVGWVVAVTVAASGSGVLVGCGGATVTGSVGVPAWATPPGAGAVTNGRATAPPTKMTASVMRIHRFFFLISSSVRSGSITATPAVPNRGPG
jgi:hypothetical protein